jgi:hypothetical protein
MKKLVANTLFCCLIFLGMSTAGKAQDSELKDATNSAYKVGQVWSYKTRPDESKSTFIVVKVDTHPKYGNIVHIAVLDLKMKNPRSADGVSDKITHMPFSEDAIAESAVKMLKESADLPDFEEGYNLWRKAFDRQSAGFYTITIAQAVKIAEEGLNQ